VSGEEDTVVSALHLSKIDHEANVEVAQHPKIA